LFVDCPVHGLVPTFGLIGGTGQVNIVDVRANCPLCGRIGQMRDGSYTIVNSVVRAFREAGASRDDVARLHDIAKAVQKGAITPEEADKQAAALGNAFLAVWRTLNAQGAGISTVVAIIALFLMIYFEQQSDADAAKLQAATEKQIEVTQSVERVERQILEELRKQSAAPPKPQMQPTPRPQTPQSTQPQTQVKATGPNRRDRRKAKALQRRQSRS
jgi:hypothetical protein